MIYGATRVAPEKAVFRPALSRLPVAGLSPEREMKVGLERCGSPIEMQLAEALMRMGKFSPRVSSDHEWEIGRWEGLWLALLAQPSYGEYRCDFGISSFLPPDITDPPFIFIVEADGHNYHERTKAQAAHDRRRDRWMAATGAHVLRFTGSEIYASADECAEEVMDFVWHRLQEPNLKRHWMAYCEQQGKKA